MADFLRSLQGAEDPEIRVLSKQSVNPSSPTPRHGFFLPALDTLWQDLHYNRRLLFYRSPQSPPSAIALQLKQSLADCLVHYFPWCGRLALAPDPPHRLFIDCNDAGVEFVEASVDMPISVLAQDGFQMKPFFEKLCQMPDHRGEFLFSSPLLSVQVTFFSDGGIALGVSQSHVVADGQSLWNFMISWGECSRGLPLSLPPQHDRERLALPEASPEKGSLWRLVIDVKDVAKTKSNGRAEEADEAPVKDESTKANAAAAAAAAAAAGSEPLVQCAMELSAAAAAALKREAGGGFSSYEVICAHLWQRSTAARQLEDEDPIYFTCLANGRSRLSPPLPASYFGNVIAFKFYPCTAGQICRESLQAVAGRIHDLVVQTQESITIFMNYLEVSHPKLMDMLLSQGLPTRGKGHNVASSPRFPVYEVDFGWDRPVAVRAAKVAGEGEIVFFGGRPGSTPGDVEICTALPASILQRLFDDPQFRAQLPSSQASHKA